MGSLTEEMGNEMAMRMMEHMLQYGEPSPYTLTIHGSISVIRIGCEGDSRLARTCKRTGFA